MSDVVPEFGELVKEAGRWEKLAEERVVMNQKTKSTAYPRMPSMGVMRPVAFGSSSSDENPLRIVVTPGIIKWTGVRSGRVRWWYCIRNCNSTS